MKFKKIFLTIIILFFIMFLFAGCQKNSSTELLSFELNDDGLSYKVVGVNGECPTNIVVPAIYKGLPVTVIGYRAFAEKSKLESVVLPNTIIEIEVWAFDTCTALKEINIPNSVVAIRSSAFSYCISLTDIVIPDSTKELEGGAFRGCKSLRKVYLGKNIKTIEKSTFYECTALREIDLPQNLEEIGESAFCFCENLILSELPSSLIKIGQSAFWGCSSIMCLTLPEGLETIEVGAFGGCASMFEICNKSSIDIEVGSNANNYGASSLKRIITDISQSNFRTDNDFIIYDDGEEIIVTKYIGNSEEVVFPEYTNGIKYTIYSSVIPVYNQVKSITLPKSIKHIERHAFEHCLNLETLIIACEGAGIDSSAFSRSDYPITGVMNSIKNIYINSQISLDGENFYGQFSNVENIVFGEGVTCIPAHFIQCDRLKNVELPSTIEEIGVGAFYGCRGLASITIPDDIKITEIKDKTFYNCAFESFTIPKNVTYIGDSAFSYCGALVEVNILGDVTVIDDQAFMQCTQLETINLPSSIEIIGASAFSGCDMLKTIDISENSALREIRESAFKNCISITKIFLPKGLESIGVFAFAGCDRLITIQIHPENPNYVVYNHDIYNHDLTVFVYKTAWMLETVTIPASVKEIGEGAFYSAYVNRVVFEEGSALEAIDEKAFYWCEIKSITLPKTLRVIKEDAFSHCQELRTVNFEDGICLERIEERAFADCYQLYSISLPSSVKFIGTGAFVWGSLDDIYYKGTLEEWKEIVKEAGWINNTFPIELHCVDQTILIE